MDGEAAAPRDQSRSKMILLRPINLLEGPRLCRGLSFEGIPNTGDGITIIPIIEIFSIEYRHV